MNLKQKAREAATWPTVQEAADDYGMSYRMIRGAIERGEVESARIGKIRVNPESVERWVASRFSE